MNELNKVAKHAIEPSAEKTSYWHPVAMERNKVEAIPEYALDNPEKLATQLVAQFQFTSEAARIEARDFLIAKLKNVDFDSYAHHPEKLRDFIYEMF